MTKIAVPTLAATITLALALGLLAGCDRQTAEPAQPADAPSASASAEQLTGRLDRTFAGQPIPNVTVADPSGAKLSLRDTGGKPTLLNLWATWCAPCVVEMPLLDGLAGALGDSVRVLTVSEDLNGADKVTTFFETKKFANLPRWMDPESDLAIAYGGGAVLPLTVLYDGQGREVWRVIGGYDWSSKAARAQVTEGVAGAPAAGAAAAKVPPVLTGG